MLQLLSSSQLCPQLKQSQVTAASAHSTEEKWLSRCPLQKASLLGCLPLVTNECGLGLGARGMKSVMQSSH